MNFLQILFIIFTVGMFLYSIHKRKKNIEEFGTVWEKAINEWINKTEKESKDIILNVFISTIGDKLRVYIDQNKLSTDEALRHIFYFSYHKNNKIWYVILSIFNRADIFYFNEVYVQLLISSILSKSDTFSGYLDEIGFGIE